MDFISFIYLARYDAVTVEGKLQWQDQLSHLNKPFFDVCDGIFVNYTWKRENPVLSVALAGPGRQYDVFFGCDIFGRGSYGGGGLETHVAVSVLVDAGVSVALFAPGWVLENRVQEDEEREFLRTDDQFLTASNSRANVGSNVETGDEICVGATVGTSTDGGSLQSEGMEGGLEKVVMIEGKAVCSAYCHNIKVPRSVEAVQSDLLRESFALWSPIATALMKRGPGRGPTAAVLSGSAVEQVKSATTLPTSSDLTASELEPQVGEGEADAHVDGRSHAITGPAVNTISDVTKAIAVDTAHSATSVGSSTVPANSANTTHSTDSASTAQSVSSNRSILYHGDNASKWTRIHGPVAPFTITFSQAAGKHMFVGGRRYPHWAPPLLALRNSCLTSSADSVPPMESQSVPSFTSPAVVPPFRPPVQEVGFYDLRLQEINWTMDSLLVEHRGIRANLCYDHGELS